MIDFDYEDKCKIDFQDSHVHCHVLLVKRKIVSSNYVNHEGSFLFLRIFRYAECVMKYAHMCAVPLRAATIRCIYARIIFEASSESVCIALSISQKICAPFGCVLCHFSYIDLRYLPQIVSVTSPVQPQ